MFYSHQLLNRRGKFGIIWIAAIKSDRDLKKKDIMTVKIFRQCNDIVEIILGQGRPFHAGDPRPRFSLRMSALLMLGVIRIYKRQILFVYDELCHLVSRLVAQKVLPAVNVNIDLKTSTK
ncbi:Uncharacterised protein g4061 [Pycnogonum litorale]